MTLAERLRSERKLLGLSQAQLALLGGIQANAQGLYEKGSRSPRADYLGCLAALGMDVQFIVLGVRAPSSMAQLCESESRVIHGLRSLQAEQREVLEQIIKNLARLMAVDVESNPSFARHMLEGTGA